MLNYQIRTDTAKNAKTYSLYRNIQSEKTEYYRESVEITETVASIELQSLMGHTMKK